MLDPLRPLLPSNTDDSHYMFRTCETPSVFTCAGTAFVLTQLFAYFGDEFYLREHQKLPHSSHGLYIEAVIGAIFLDGGYEKVSEWICEIFGLDKLSGVLESNYGKKVSEPIPHWPRW